MRPSLVLVAALPLCVSGGAQAAQYFNETLWHGAVSNSFVVDHFETYSVGSTFGTDALLGVTVAPLSGGVMSNIETALNGTSSFHTGFNVLMNGPTFPGAGPMTISPGTTAFMAMGFWDTRPASGTTILSFYRANNTVIDQVSNGPSGSPAFIGLISPEPVAYAIVSKTGDGWIAMDDLQVSTVPAPGMAVLLGSGALVFSRRRR